MHIAFGVDMDDKYYSFNDLNRPAMFLGVPIMTSIFLAMIILLLSALMFFLFKLVGLLITLFVGVLVFFFCRILCENDPNGLYNKKYFILGFMLRMKMGSKIIVLSSSNFRF